MEAEGSPLKLYHMEFRSKVNVHILVAVVCWCLCLRMFFGLLPLENDLYFKI